MPINSALNKITNAIAIGFDANKFLSSQRRKYGDSFYVEMPGYQRVFVTSSPEEVKKIFQASNEVLTSALPNPLELLLGQGSLILMQDDQHTVERKQLVPFFQGQALREYALMMRDVVQQSMANWDSTISAQKIMQHLTLEIIIHIVFGVKDSQRKIIYKKMIEDLLVAFSPFLMLLPFLRHSFFGFGPWARFCRLKDEFDRLVFEDIRKLSDSGADGANAIINKLVAIHTDSKGCVNAKHVRDELTTLLIAGHETTANSLAWALYFIAENGFVQARLVDEIKMHNGNMTMDELMKLPYLDAVCKEVLRLFPVVPVVLRTVRQPFTIADVTLEPGAYVGIATPLLHSHPRVWTEPKSFNPDRFIGKKYSPFEFMPFGGGHKKCLGFGFALYEMKIILSQILTCFNLSLVSKVQVKPSIQGITMGPDKEINVSLERRKTIK